MIVPITSISPTPREYCYNTGTVILNAIDDINIKISPNDTFNYLRIYIIYTFKGEESVHFNIDIRLTYTSLRIITHNLYI